METFGIKIDLNRQTVQHCNGFEKGISFEGGTRTEFASRFERPGYRFYLAGLCYSLSSRDQVEAWLDNFDPSAIDAWARQIDGDLVILIEDTERREAILVSDRNGVARAYYAFSSGFVFVSNSRHEIIRLVGSARISSFAAYQLLTIDYVIDPESLLEDVLVTMPGQIIRFTASGDSEKRQYYSPVKLDSDYFDTEQQCVSALDAAYRRVFTKRVGTSRTPIVMLSGGIDSLTIMKYLKECYSGKIISLTYSFKGLYPNELEPARMAAKHFGTEHHEVVIDPEDAGALFIQNLQTNAADAAYVTSFAIKAYLERLGGEFDLFTGQDTRLHTPPFDNTTKVGIYLNRNPESTRVARSLASIASIPLAHWPVDGPLRRYLQFWAKTLQPKSDLNTYLRGALTTLGSITNPIAHGAFYQSMVREFPRFERGDTVQQIFKKHVAFEYRVQYTDDMNCLRSTLTGPRTRVHCPFYDWEAVEVSNRVPYDIGMKGDFTLKTWNKMPYVRKRIARLLVRDSVPDSLLYRAKKTCPFFDLAFNSSLRSTARDILQTWLAPLLNELESPVANLAKGFVASFSSKSHYNLYDDHLLRKVGGICYLTILNQVCNDPWIRLNEALASATSESTRRAADLAEPVPAAGH